MVDDETWLRRSAAAGPPYGSSMGLVVDGRVEHVPGLTIHSWRDEPLLRLAAPGRRPRGTRWVRSIAFHATHVDRPTVRPGSGPPGAWVAPPAQERRPGFASCHAAIRGDGTIAWFADAVDEITYHAPTLDEVSIGIEIAQHEPGEVWDAQLDAAVRLTDFLTARLGIQRQFHVGRADTPRLAAGGRDCVGIFGGPAALFERLARAGYERWDFGDGADLAAWRQRQSDLNDRRIARIAVDGIPGPSTARALRRAGSPAGMWIPRPGD
jgi:hypothetical protein